MEEEEEKGEKYEFQRCLRKSEFDNWGQSRSSSQVGCLPPCKSTSWSHYFEQESRCLECSIVKCRECLSNCHWSYNKHTGWPSVQEEEREVEGQEKEEEVSCEKRKKSGFGK